MLNLRIFGGLISILTFYLFYRLYRRRRGKIPLLLGIIFSLSLLLVSLKPNVLNIFVRFLTNTREEFFRIIVLLSVAVMMLSYFVIRLLFQIDYQERKFREFTLNHGLRKFHEYYNKSAIKPIQVVIPAYNEAENLREILPDIPPEIDSREVGVLVISDGSNDNTRAVVNEAGYHCIETMANLGGGAALQVGFKICQEYRPDVVVTMDGDGQHRPDEIEKLIKPVINNEVDVAVGSRIKGEERHTPMFRKLGIYFFNGLISLLVGQSLTDCSNGFRAFQSGVLDDIEHDEPQFHTTEFLIQAIAHDRSVGEIPVTVHPRQKGDSKKPPDVIYGWGFFKAILRTWLRY